jgi:CheY-like chemotaxis protein
MFVGTKSSDNGESRSKGVHILLVEDDAETLRVTARLLTRRGFVVTTATTVTAAIAAADKNTFDFLISDVGLPDGSGRDIVAALKAKQRIRSIAVTGYGMTTDIEKNLDAGFDEHLTKPISCEDVEAAIARIST